jgi:hypothetical protein
MKRYNKENQSLFEMSNLTKEDTGLPFIIWISPKSGKEGHWARIKVEYNNTLYPISISDDPEWKMTKQKENPFSAKQTALIKKFIQMNKDLLLEYWNSSGTMSLKVVFKKMKKVK